MKALVFNNKIVQVVKDEETFDIHESMAWVSCPEDVTDEWLYDGKSFAPQTYEGVSYDIHRKNNYPSVAEQLDILYHEGYDGWKAVVQSVKDQFPKP